METIAQALRNVGPGRLLVVGAVVLGMIIFLAVFVTKFTSPAMKVLYEGLEATDSSRVVQQLQVMGVAYEIKQGNSQILVPEAQVGQVRLQLADQGLPGAGSMGYEIFDKSEALGTTSFVQDVNLVRALEGEISRTIETIDSVKSARVHLVLPKRELFSKDKTEPSASVVLRMKGATRLPSEQVAAVQHLIAAAVPGLAPNRVSIIDNKGKLLAAGFEEDGATAAASKAEEKKQAVERRMARTIEELLERTVGFGKVRAEVHAQMDFDRVSTQEEKYDPDGQVVQSTQTIEQIASARDAEGQPNVSVGTNLPDATGDGGESQSSTSSESRTEETTNFAITKVVTNHIHETGTIKKLSVAVLVDGERVKNEDDDFVYQPRGEEEMELLATLVRSAIGYNQDRGDVVEIINMEFAEFEEPEEELELFFGLGKNDLLQFAEILVLGIVILLIVLLVVRPLISRAFETLPSAAQAASERLLADQTGAAPALAGPAGPAIPTPADTGEEEEFEELIDIDRVEGRVKASSVKKVGEIVDKHPEEALSIIRAWMYQEA